ncbi:hypothetical protein L1987_30033 [Smallanthus sonchifolius]|uniref:Uncharacterized protein n=1 Tax=Smallanthus sonchifolius TaxID=185202 RepID=A0ACB9I2Z5_9ASTR|nr:hypothetical protein L1987_30033 [Smallanthus sonchifolius]
MDAEPPNGSGAKVEEGEIVADEDSGGRPGKPPVIIDQGTLGNEPAEVEQVENLAAACLHGEGTWPHMGNNENLSVDGNGNFVEITSAGRRN